jgi:hypothetical protein
MKVSEQAAKAPCAKEDTTKRPSESLAAEWLGARPLLTAGDELIWLNIVLAEFVRL